MSFEIHILNNADAKICGPCAGECCKAAPGIALPEDFGAPNTAHLFFRLAAALRTGRWTLDQWEGDPRDGFEDGVPGQLDGAPFVRPAIVGREGQLLHRPWLLGPCTFLTPAGCSMEFEQRPHECRSLVPTVGLRCTSHDKHRGRQDYAIAWVPYIAVVKSVIEQLQAEKDA